LASIEGICGRTGVSIAHERGEYSSTQTTTHELGHKSVCLAFITLVVILLAAVCSMANLHHSRVQQAYTGS